MRGDANLSKGKMYHAEVVYSLDIKIIRSLQNCKSGPASSEQRTTKQLVNLKVSTGKTKAQKHPMTQKVTEKIVTKVLEKAISTYFVDSAHAPSSRIRINIVERITQQSHE